MIQCPPHGMKIFVRENEPDKIQPSRSESRYFPKEVLTGKQAKQFYEDTVATEGQRPLKVKKKLPHVAVKVKSKQKLSVVKQSTVFRLAQDNDVGELRTLFTEHTVDINGQDMFGWTPLMCAACNGSNEAVNFLLSQGANPFITDSAGNNALKLAKRGNHKDVVRILRNGRQMNDNDEKILEDTKSYESEAFFCVICNLNINGDKQQHELSTTHLLSAGSTIPSRTFYKIPESNKGFQLLLKKGWDRERGLGPDGSGKKFPIKTKLKNNRRGIGAQGQDKCDFTLTKKRIKATTKKDISRREKHEKKMARNFRLEFV